MIDENGIVKIGTVAGVTYGVSIGDLQTVFGTARNDIGQIIVNEDINKWAKFKPLRSNKLGVLTDAERVELNQGLVMTKYTSPADFIAGYENDYAYLRPRGKATYNEWFRFLDFNGYNHLAEGPVSSFACPSGDVIENQDIIVRLYLNPSSQVPTGSLLWSDFDPEEDHLMSEYYFGVIIKTVGSSTYRVLTMDTPIGTGYPIQEMALTLPASLFTLMESYTIYPILSYTPYTTVTQQSAYVTGFYSVPDAEPRTIQIRTVLIMVSIAITDFTATSGSLPGRWSWSLTGAMQVNAGTTVTGEILYRIYEGTYDPETGHYSGDIIESGQFYYGQIPMAPSQVTHTITGTKRTTAPQYLTAVLSYQGRDCSPVTISFEEEL